MIIIAHRRHVAVTSLFIACLIVFSSYGDFFPNRIYKVRCKQNLNQSWKFIKADPANASSVDFDDALWQTVNLPHSAQYDAPTADGEQKSVPLSSAWNGVHWYRKAFLVPSTQHNKKVFIEFDGAMQIAQIYINGKLIGTHDACGFTGFHFDITDAINTTGSNVLAVRLDCRYRNNIPPGRAGTFDVAGNSMEYPDFFLYSGLYRDVWLVCTDNVYIPINGQKIETPLDESSSARVRVKTTVRNDNGNSRSVTLSFCIADPNNTVVTRCDMTRRIEPGASCVFDTTTASIDNPKLWSPDTPTLYRVYTTVSRDSGVVDDYVERFGIRSIQWTKAGGFFLNNQRFLLKGVCMHQEFAWVGNAVPRSRFFEEVTLAKEMGANAVRCAHYPRAPAFYNACDEIGIICAPELPSWGCCGKAAYPSDFWDRMNTAAQEMVDVGYNHPSIIMWGMFNEPRENFQTQFRKLNAALQQLDSTRSTSIYGSSTQIPYYTAEIYGMNYEFYPNASIRNQMTGSFVSEYYEGWVKWCYRGDTATKNDAALSGPLSENRFASDRWSGSNNWMQIAAAWNASTQPVPGGGFMWCFVDYWSPAQDYPMGVLDIYRIPKKAFYTFRFNWTGAADDNAVAGMTPTRVRLDADRSTLIADSTDITRIIGSLRDATGKCAFGSRNITLHITGPVDCFDSLTKTTIAGKIGWVLKSKNASGTVKVIASSAGLSSDTVSIACESPDNSSLPFIWQPNKIAAFPSHFCKSAISMIRQTPSGIVVQVIPSGDPKTVVSLTAANGKTVARVTVANQSYATINLRTKSAGIYILSAGKETIQKVFIAEQKK